VKVLRIICGDKEEERDARRTKKLYNYELRNLCSSLHIGRRIQRKRMDGWSM
jgi:hypothetical protein